MREPSPLASFARFVAGFVVFLSVSLGLTFAVSVYAAGKDAKAQAAAALEGMLGQ